MNKITQKQINDAAEAQAKSMLEHSKSIDKNLPEALLSEFFKKAVKWYRMEELATIDDKSHPDLVGYSTVTSSDGEQLHVDNYPEILEWLRINHKHRYVIYSDCITIYCNDQVEASAVRKKINAVRSIKL